MEFPIPVHGISVWFRVKTVNGQYTRPRSMKKEKFGAKGVNILTLMSFRLSQNRNLGFNRGVILPWLVIVLKCPSNTLKILYVLRGPFSSYLYINYGWSLPVTLLFYSITYFSKIETYHSRLILHELFMIIYLLFLKELGPPDT